MNAQKRLFGKDEGCCRVGHPTFLEGVGSSGKYKSYDTSKSICCSGKLNKRSVSANTGCCNQKAYDVRNEICCGVNVCIKFHVILLVLSLFLSFFLSLFLFIYLFIYRFVVIFVKVDFRNLELSGNRKNVRDIESSR